MLCVSESAGWLLLQQVTQRWLFYEFRNVKYVGKHFLHSIWPIPWSSLRLVQLLSPVWIFTSPWTAARQASLSITHSQNLLKLFHVHWVGDVIHLFHTLLSPPPPAFNLSQHRELFQRVSSSHQVTRVLEPRLQLQSFQWIFRTDFL